MKISPATLYSQSLAGTGAAQRPAPGRITVAGMAPSGIAQGNSARTGSAVAAANFAASGDGAARAGTPGRILPRGSLVDIRV